MHNHRPELKAHNVVNAVVQAAEEIKAQRVIQKLGDIISHVNGRELRFSSIKRGGDPSARRKPRLRMYRGVIQL